MRPLEYRTVPGFLKSDRMLSVLMPFLNESAVIVENTRETIRILEEMGIRFEIILIDDGSTDGSYRLLENEFSRHSKVMIIRNQQNFGKGWALKTGYEFSHGDYILFMDSDLELSPWHIPNFFRILIENNADCVIGSKLHPDSQLSYPLKRRLFSMVYYTMVKILFGLSIKDTQTGIKLFSREALESSLPKVLVKHFAFDIELLLQLTKNSFRISEAPIELEFRRETSAGRIRLSSIFNMVRDTLAIFYRDRILGFYNRPLGPNIPFHYSLVLFSDEFNASERNNLLHYLNIQYRQYEVIVASGSPVDLQNDRLTVIETGPLSPMEKLEFIMKKHPPRGDFVLFASLNSSPDERFLLSMGRILSQPGIGAAGGFVTLMKDAAPFEKISYKVLSSIFLNMNLVYRYKPMNVKAVNELQFDGFFARRDLLDNIDFSLTRGLKPEFVLSRAATKNGLKCIYSPDIMLYKRFPATPGALFSYISSQPRQRAFQLRTPAYKGRRTFKDWEFLVAIVFFIFLGLSFILPVITANPLSALPLAVYLLIVLLSRLTLYGLDQGFRIFYLLIISQVIYALGFVKAIFIRYPR